MNERKKKNNIFTAGSKLHYPDRQVAGFFL